MVANSAVDKSLSRPRFVKKHDEHYKTVWSGKKSEKKRQKGEKEVDPTESGGGGERETAGRGARSAAIRFICRNWGSFNALNQTPVMAAIKLPTIT